MLGLPISAIVDDANVSNALVYRAAQTCRAWRRALDVGLARRRASVERAADVVLKRVYRWYALMEVEDAVPRILRAMELEYGAPNYIHHPRLVPALHCACRMTRDQLSLMFDVVCDRTSTVTPNRAYISTVTPNRACIDAVERDVSRDLTLLGNWWRQQTAAASAARTDNNAVCAVCDDEQRTPLTLLRVVMGEIDRDMVFSRWRGASTTLYRILRLLLLLLSPMPPPPPPTSSSNRQPSRHAEMRAAIAACGRGATGVRRVVARHRQRCESPTD